MTTELEKIFNEIVLMSRIDHNGVQISHFDKISNISNESFKKVVRTLIDLKILKFHKIVQNNMLSIPYLKITKEYKSIKRLSEIFSHEVLVSFQCELDSK